MSRFKLALAVAASCWLAGCDTVRDLVSTPDPPLQGRRLAVLPSAGALTSDARISDVRIVLPRPAENEAWPQQAGYPNHAMHHLALGRDPRTAWTVGIGAGSADGGLLSFSRNRRLLAQPVVGDGRVFAMDSAGVVGAFDLQSGRRLWSGEVLPDHEREGDVGGGIAYDDGRLIAATGAAEVVAMDAASGRILWRSSTGAPVRSAPAASDGRIFVVTAENTTIAYNASDGKKLWSHEGVAAPTGILGNAAPAVDEDVVVAPRSTGEVVALRAATGRQVWTENIGATRRVGGLRAVTASPVIDRGIVYAVSNAGRLAAIELGSGRRLWDIEMSGMQTPWAAGDYLFVLTTGAVLAAIRRSDGRVRWAIGLDRFTNDDDLIEGRPFWTGPVLAGDRLVVAGSHGEALAVSPYTGEVIGWIPLDEGVFIPPAIAQRTILFLDDSGRLTAMR